jgi:hypothetical protein
MNTKPKKTMLVRTMYIMVVLVVVLSVSTVVYAAPPSPFVGHWEAIDVDGSDMNLAIGGPPAGPFRITWTDDYISFCGGEAGIVRGTGWLNEGDSNLLEADVHLECFTTGDTLDFHVTFRYHPVTNTLSIKYYFGQVTIWHRPGGGQAEEPPALGLRVNYGHNWVESFYEGGHTAWITVTESDGVTVKATAELVTEPKDFWGGETGFQTTPEDWSPGPPDIQPFDWVFGWVDNGASAQVQIGEISGMIDLNADSIQGTVNVPWFLNQQVEVECLPWGAPTPMNNVTYGMITPDNTATYSCSWAGEWDIQPYQDVGVGYFGPDGHWVANAFTAPNPRLVGSESGDWFWTTEFYPGMLDLFIYESADEDAALLWSGQQEADQWGFTIIGYDVHGQNLMEGNYLVVSDGVNQKGLVMQPISVTVFDTENEIMAGFAPTGSEVWVAAGPQDWQERIMVNADPVTGEWFADFAEIGFDITEDMRSWSYAHVYDGDGDANEGNTPLPGATLIVIASQPDWVDSGITISAGQSFTIEAFGLMNPCSDTYPNGADYCIFYTPLGAEGVVPYENEFGIFPGPGLRFMALLGRIGDGESFYIGAGGTFTAEQAGTLWFTPNDNLRTDNQGAYSMLVWLEP